MRKKQSKLLLPSKYGIATKYKQDKDVVAVFPNEFIQYDVNDLPLADGKVDHYFFAQNYQGDLWEIDTFDKGGGHGGFKTKGNKSDVLTHIKCLANAEELESIDDKRAYLDQCRKKFNLKVM